MAPVLMYHSVSRVASGPLRSLAVPPDLLREQLGALVAAGYRLVGLSEAVDLLARDPGTRVAALTFDDGYLDFLRYGVPTLAELGATATLYAPVGHLGQPAAAWLGAGAEAFGPLLTWPQLAEVAQAGIEIGNHGLVHHPLDVLRPAQRDREIAESRDRLVQALDGPVRSFCYPHGYHVRGVRLTVRRAGHDNACEIGYRLFRPDDDPLAIPRLQPTPDHSGADLLRLAEGGDPRLAPRVKRAVRPGWRATRRVALDVFGKRLT
jgi:peptidoglycan/xylan/chitin deacetylase (PgdA/CDA1 family)